MVWAYARSGSTTRCVWVGGGRLAGNQAPGRKRCWLCALHTCAAVTVLMCASTLTIPHARHAPRHRYTSELVREDHELRKAIAVMQQNRAMEIEEQYDFDADGRCMHACMEAVALPACMHGRIFGLTHAGCIACGSDAGHAQHGHAATEIILKVSSWQRMHALGPDHQRADLTRGAGGQTVKVRR